MQMIQDAVRDILIAIGEDPNREGLLDTPRRVAKMYLNELSQGINADLSSQLSTTFDEGHRELVIVKQIPFYSLCEHHMVPYFGIADVGYIPNGKIVGLSKIARLVDLAARTLSVQERLTSQIADTIQETLQPMGTMVVVRAQHLCMAMRGVEKPGSTTITSAIRGVFDSNEKARGEFLELIKL